LEHPPYCNGSDAKQAPLIQARLFEVHTDFSASGSDEHEMILCIVHAWPDFLSLRSNAREKNGRNEYKR